MNNRRHFLASGTAFLIGGIGGAVKSDAATSLVYEDQNACLGGVTGFNLSLNDFSADIEADGFTKVSTQSFVETRLKNAKVPLVSDADILKYPGIPQLQLIVNTLKSSDGSMYIFSLWLNLSEMVTLMRKPTVYSACNTWTSGKFGTLPINSLAFLSQDVGDLVDQFTAAWQSANPK